MWYVICVLVGLLAGVLIGQWRGDRYMFWYLSRLAKRPEVRECLSQFLERYWEGMTGEEIAEMWAELRRGKME